MTGKEDAEVICWAMLGTSS